MVAPPGDARQDLWIIQEIGKRMGLDWNYPGPAEVFTEMASLMPSLANITWERLEREGAVTYPVDASDIPGNEIIFTTGYPTETGRGKSCRPVSSRPTRFPTTNIRWCYRPGACSNIGTQVQ